MKVADDTRDGPTLSSSQEPSGLEVQNGDTQGTAWDVVFAKVAQLQAGWNGYHAPAPSERALLWARDFVKVLLRENFPPTRLAPSVVGGVATTHRRGQKKVYVEFYNDGRALAVFSDDVSEPVIQRVEPAEAAFTSLIAEMRDYLHA